MRLGASTRGITSVLGTVLMVGVTVVVAAALGVAALVVVDQAQNPPPAVTVETDQRVGTVVETNDFNGTAPSAQANRSVTFVHTAGPPVDPDRLSVTVNGYPAYDVFDSTDGGSRQ